MLWLLTKNVHLVFFFGMEVLVGRSCDEKISLLLYAPPVRVLAASMWPFGVWVRLCSIVDSVSWPFGVVDVWCYSPEVGIVGGIFSGLNSRGSCVTSLQGRQSGGDLKYKLRIWDGMKMDMMNYRGGEVAGLSRVVSGAISEWRLFCGGWDSRNI
jgi:hypothetical protein